MTSEAPLTTHHASPHRQSRAELGPIVAAVDADPAVRNLLSAFPQIAAILNADRQIIAANRSLLNLLGVDDPELLIGQRLGETLHCVHADDMPAGCGTSEACQYCGAVNAMLRCQTERRQTCDECRLSVRTPDGLHAIELRVHVTPLQINAQDLLILAANDLSATHRREALERTFFHDVLNVAGGILSLSQMLQEGEPTLAPRYAQRIHRLSRQLVEQVRMQRDLAAAEDGRLRPIVRRISLSGALDALRAAAEADPVAIDRRLDIQNHAPPELTLNTDPVLLQRVLLNLVRNALEASAVGGAATVRARVEDDQLVCDVHNDAVMPRSVQMQIFQRSFSTKIGRGRGLGTFSAKLLAEDYLDGALSFASAEGAGTTFTLRLPVEAELAETDDINPQRPQRRALLLVGAAPSTPGRAARLRAAGLSIVTARTASEAVSAVLAANQTPHPFELLLLDVPGGDSETLQAVRALRRAGLHLPALALLGDPAAGERCQAAGCDALLPSDAPADRLRTTLRELLN